MKQVLQPEGWAMPKGYANGVAASGQWVVLAGQIGWNAQAQFDSDDLVDQVRQALLNVRALLAEAGCGPEHMVRMTWWTSGSTWPAAARSAPSTARCWAASTAWR